MSPLDCASNYKLLLNKFAITITYYTYKFQLQLTVTSYKRKAMHNANFKSAYIFSLNRIRGAFNLSVLSRALLYPLSFVHSTNQRSHLAYTDFPQHPP